MAWLGLAALVAGALGFMMVFVACAVLALRAAIWVVLLPFRLLFGVLTLPWLLVKTIVLGAGALVAVVAAVGLVVALLVPLLPLVFIGVVTWAIVRLMRRPAAQANLSATR